MDKRELDRFFEDIKRQKKGLPSTQELEDSIKNLYDSDPNNHPFSQKCNYLMGVLDNVASFFGFDLNKNPYQNQKWKNYS